MDVTNRTLSAYVDFDQIAGYHLHAKSLKLKRNKNALAQLAGSYKTRIRGRAEFEDVDLSVAMMSEASTGESAQEQRCPR